MLLFIFFKSFTWSRIHLFISPKVFYKSTYISEYHIYIFLKYLVWQLCTAHIIFYYKIFNVKACDNKKELYSICNCISVSMTLWYLIIIFRKNRFEYIISIFYTYFLLKIIILLYWMLLNLFLYKKTLLQHLYLGTVFFQLLCVHFASFLSFYF